MEKPNRSTLTGDRAASAGRRHAVVIGGSMAGLLAGRVLADHFDQVTIIERDTYSDAPVPRQGVPQANHLHVLLARGLQIMEQLFPGLRGELMAAGAVAIESGSDLAWLTPAGWGLRFDAGVPILAFSRPLLDWAIRRRLQAVRNIRFMEASEVTELLPNADRTGVEGVAVRSRLQAVGTTVSLEAETSDDERLPADLVVDASGRGSRAPRWLAALGYTPPNETVVNAHLGYASRLYERAADFAPTWKAVLLQAAPPARVRAAVLFPIEGGRWILTLCGGDRDYPPTDETGYLNFAESLPSPIVHDTIKGATPVSPIYQYRATENRLRCYEQMARFPERFILLGDAVCAFNPVYGQGMTVAAISALELDRCLRKAQRRSGAGVGAGFSRRFQRRLAKVNTLPWALATGEDCHYREAAGSTPHWTTRLIHRYTDRVLVLTMEHADVRKLWLEVFEMLKPASALFHPTILMRLIRRAVTWPRAVKGTAQMATDSSR